MAGVEGEGFPQVLVSRKTGTESFRLGDKSLDLTLQHFWAWSTSDLVSNATRGILAEFIVASALRRADGVRAEWDSFDVQFGPLKIEVKSGAYLQSWFHKKLSAICFNIRPTFGWDAATNQLATELKRQADLYVFCVLNHKDKATADPLNLDQWEFYLLRASDLDAAFPTQKSVRLASLLKLPHRKVSYREIAAAVKEMETGAYTS